MEKLPYDTPSELIYSSDLDDGFTRRGAGNGFAYYDEQNTLISDEKTKHRLNSLAIPPAYTDVWYCAEENGYLQSTGIDTKGRKQYRYHPLWNEWRNLKKFNSLLDFAAVLPKIRRRVTRGLTSDELNKEKVLCSVVRLLDKTAARIGNEVYYKENGSTGLTTLRDDNVESDDGYLQLHYIAKGGTEREFDLYQPSLAEIVTELQDLPGQRLFQYVGIDKKIHPITSSDVNDWLKKVGEIDLSAKDFRTWHASELCLDHFLKQDEPDSNTARVRLEKEVLKLVSAELGHRPPVCKKHYVHPQILKLQREGALHSTMAKCDVVEVSSLTASEVNFISFLKAL